MRSVDASLVRLFDPSEFVLRPDPVVDAWYAADCPPNFNARPFVTKRQYIEYRIRRWLRRHVPVWMKQLICTHRWLPDHFKTEEAWCRNCQQRRAIERDPA